MTGSRGGDGSSGPCAITPIDLRGICSGQRIVLVGECRYLAREQLSFGDTQGFAATKSERGVGMGDLVVQVNHEDGTSGSASARRVPPTLPVASNPATSMPRDSRRQRADAIMTCSPVCVIPKQLPDAGSLLSPLDLNRTRVVASKLPPPVFPPHYEDGATVGSVHILGATHQALEVPVGAEPSRGPIGASRARPTMPRNRTRQPRVLTGRPIRRS